MHLTLPQVLFHNLIHCNFINGMMFVPIRFYHLPVFYSLVGNCLMQRAARAGSEAAALFLATHGAKVNHVNKWVCMNIHITLHSFDYKTWCASSMSFIFFVKIFLLKDAQITLQLQ